MECLYGVGGGGGRKQVDPHISPKFSKNGQKVSWEIWKDYSQDQALDFTTRSVKVSCTRYSSVIKTSPRAETLTHLPIHTSSQRATSQPAQSSPAQLSPDTEHRVAQQEKPGQNSSRSHWVGGMAGLRNHHMSDPASCQDPHPLGWASDTYVSKISRKICSKVNMNALVGSYWTPQFLYTFNSFTSKSQITPGLWITTKKYLQEAMK